MGQVIEKIRQMYAGKMLRLNDVSLGDEGVIGTTEEICETLLSLERDCGYSVDHWHTYARDGVRDRLGNYVMTVENQGC